MKKSLALLAALLNAASSASAMEWHTVGARAMGMGGSGVAAAQGPLSAYWNPAALGRPTSNAYGVEVPFGAHAAVTGSVLEGARDLQNLKDNPTTITQAKLDEALGKLNKPGNGVRLGAHLGANVKIGKFAFFADGFADMGAAPSVDLTATTTTVVAGTNNSKLTLKGAQIMEFGVGYGHELPFAQGVYVGGNLKLMSAQVGYYDYFVLRNTNDNPNMLSKLKEGARRSANVGVDLGALWDVDRTFEDVWLKPKIGLVGRNLNNPKFKRPDAAIAAGLTDKFAVNPQVRLGASISPFNWWHIASDLDLTRNLTPTDGVASRQFGVGSEFNVFNRTWINIPLRVGLTRNLAEPGSGTMLTAGAGLNFLHVIVDVSGALSPKRVTTQSQGKSTKIPRELSGALQLSLLFGGNDEPEAPSREWRSAPQGDGQPVPAEKVKAASDKAHQDLDAEAKK